MLLRSASACSRLEAGEAVAEDAVVAADVVAALVRELQRVALVAQADRLARREVAVDVVDRDDGLHQDVLPDDAVFRVPARIAHAAEVALGRDRGVLAEGELAARELRVGAQAAATELIVRRRALLVEVVRRHAVRVILTRAGHVQVVVPDRSLTVEHRLPPVGALAGGHDQRVRIRVLGHIHVQRTAERVDRAGARGAERVRGERRVVRVAVHVRRDVLRASRVRVARLDDLEVVERVLIRKSS